MKIAQSLLSSVGKMTKLYSNLPESYIKRAMEKVFYIRCSFDEISVVPERPKISVLLILLLFMFAIIQ